MSQQTRSATLRASPYRDPIVIGLVNNMPDAALRNTERQFRRLLSAAADGLPVRLRLFYLPQVPRAQGGRCHVEQHYEAIDRLWASEVDGLIVTGTEPRAADLRDEPYWASLTRLVDWAERHTISTVWSCLAVHAAVLHTDGVARRPLPEKLFGLFECDRIDDHPIVRGTPRRWRVSHSRCNEVTEAALLARGYRLLTRSSEAGPDLFIRQGESLFVYFQGHPEYEADTLGREYRRDVGRFLTGARECYPEMPRGYFSPAASAALAALRDRAARERSPDLLSSYPAIGLEGAPGAACGTAVTIYKQWLSFIAVRKHRADWSPEPRLPGCAAAAPDRSG